MPLGNRNVIIASFVTAYARLELFEVLHKLQDSVLYYDTDSVIFVENRAWGRYIETGKYLGEMTDKLSEKDAARNGSNNSVRRVPNHICIVQTNIRKH
jgi:hypothetical protein